MIVNTMTNGKLIEYVSIILKNPDNNLWISQRINPDKAMYKWYQCPGGHIEPNESRSNALIRELYEETNLTGNNSLTYIGVHEITTNDNREHGLKRVYIYEMITKQIPNW